MTGKEFQAAGEKLFGEDWKQPMAEALGLNKTTIWRYSRSAKIPKYIELAVASLLADA